MRRTVQLKVAALITVLALAPPQLTVVVAQSPDLQLNEALAPGGGTVTGTVWQSDEDPLPDARLQLRDASTGQIVRTTRADERGRFTFVHVSRGSYIVELVDENRRVLALGEMFTMGPTETIATFIRLETRTSASWFGGFFGNAAAAAIAAAATVGLTALGNGGQPASARS